MSSKDELAGLYLQEKYDVDGDPEGVSLQHRYTIYECNRLAFSAWSGWQHMAGYLS